MICGGLVVCGGQWYVEVSGMRGQWYVVVSAMWGSGMGYLRSVVYLGSVAYLRGQ